MKTFIRISLLLLVGAASVGQALDSGQTSYKPPSNKPYSPHQPSSSYGSSSHESTSSDKSTFKDVAVKLPYGTVIGRSAQEIDTFNGIPFAEPPVGPLRLKPPQRIRRKLGKIDATGIAPACPQLIMGNQSLEILENLSSSALDSPYFHFFEGQEDCLTVSVQRPAYTKPSAKLPVLVWIYGGGFENGASRGYDGTSLLTFAKRQKQPFIYVALSYRLGGFGFLPGAEVLRDGSANLGLLDQRLALEWVADNVEHFGGDAEKVTLWGESAGAISIVHQMALYNGNATYKGKPLFRGGIMNSGSITAVKPIDSKKPQDIYNQVVKAAGCAKSYDTLSCLRKVDYQTLLVATSTLPGSLSFNSLALSYLPRPDGKVLSASTDALIADNYYHAVPMIVGDQEDEGTLFSLTQQSIRTNRDFNNYLSNIFFLDANKAQVQELINAYPSDEEGSPFRTGRAGRLYPYYKRIAALLGDVEFTLARRKFLDIATKVNPKVPAWSYIASYNYGKPYLGTLHTSDLPVIFYNRPPSYTTDSIRHYYLNFLYNLDPNKGKGGRADWPLWKHKRLLMWFKSFSHTTYGTDNFRSCAYAVILKLWPVLRL
ncbi:hypothetical protein CDD83_5614 [Cordyceps sp. RAO-2017]|nr:hypothetical protein CDD83_5614 [Cordyceps sp. RAO-2017]